jgi:hypothetical protein
MTYLVGGQPGVQFTGDDLLKGKCPSVGQRLETSDGKEYVFCLVAAAQNLIDGHLVTIDPMTFTVTIAAAGPPAPAAGNVLGVARTSVTASASAYIWVQRYGVGSVQATASTLPNIVLTMSAAAGVVDDAIATASGIIEGLILTATTAASGITACFLSYPRFTEPGMPG